MAIYHHGVSVLESDAGVRPIQDVSTAIIGIIAYASDANASIFPLDRPVLVLDPIAALGDAGTAGTLSIALRAIGDQVTAPTVVVRVAEGSSDAARDTNIIGGSTDGRYTGMHALLAAQAELGVVPKILGVPGADTQAVTAALVGIAQKLNAFVYASAWGATTKELAKTYRNNFGQRELMIVWPDFTSTDVVARALGMRAKLDRKQGWHKSLSNVPVNGVTGLSADISWSLQNSVTDAGFLNAGQVTTLINQQGYRFWGSRTCSADPNFVFEPAVRTAQFLRDTIAEAHLWAIDKPLSKTLGRDILSGINQKLRELVADEKLIGAKAWIDPAKNTATDLKAGTLLIEYDYTPVPPLENLQLVQHQTDKYLINFAADLSA